MQIKCAYLDLCTGLLTFSACLFVTVIVVEVSPIVVFPDKGHSHTLIKRRNFKDSAMTILNILNHTSNAKSN